MSDDFNIFTDDLEEKNEAVKKFIRDTSGLSLRFEKEIEREDGRVDRVRDLASEFRETIKKSPNKMYANLFQETREEKNLRLEKMRRNAFNCPGLSDQMDDDIFSLDFKKAYQAGLLPWADSHRMEYREALKWSESNPVRISDTKTRALYLAGPSRIGKSLFLKLKALEIYDAESSKNKDQFGTGVCRFINLQNFFMVYIRADELNKARMEHEFQRTKYLFLDDIGANYDTPWFNAVLQDMIGRRLFGKFHDGTKLWTFFTSNFSIEDLPYDKPIKERIKEAASEILIGKTDIPKYSAKNHTMDRFSIPRDV